MSDQMFSPVTPVPNNNMREVLERFRQRRLKSEAVLRALKEQDAAMGFGCFNDMPQLQRSDPQEAGEKKSRVDFALKNFTNTLSRTLDFPENPFLDYLAATTTMSVVLAIDHERQKIRFPDLAVSEPKNAEYEDLEFYFHKIGEAVIDGGEDPNDASQFTEETSSLRHTLALDIIRLGLRQLAQAQLESGKRSLWS
ncbi:hypothetical protein PoHVEF18_009166 [Penicillium ochrochloron]